MVEHDDGIDFALAAFREDGEWQVQDLAHDQLGDVETISHALRRLPGDGGAVAMVAVDEDFFVIVRVAGASTRVLLSDVTAADDWELASSAVEFLELPELELEDEDEQVPAGDLDLLGDLGMHAMDMGAAARRRGPLPRRDALRRGAPARVRRAVRRRRRPHLGLMPPRLGRRRWVPPSTRRARRWRPATYRSAPWSCRRPGVVVGSGRNVREAAGDPTGHAEVVAIRAAAAARWGRWRLDGCTLVVTLEPCTMCAGAAVLARLDRVVFGAHDPKAGAVGSLWDVVRDRRLNHRPEVVTGVRAEESTALLDEFFTDAPVIRSRHSPSGWCSCLPRRVTMPVWEVSEPVRPV